MPGVDVGDNTVGEVVIAVQEMVLPAPCGAYIWFSEWERQRGVETTMMINGKITTGVFLRGGSRFYRNEK